jgi:peptidoglycan-associated lipoprotein
MTKKIIIFASLFLLASSCSQAKRPKRVVQETVKQLEASNKIYFDFDSYSLSEVSKKVLNSQVERLKQNNASIIIEGHCDERGTQEYNLALGQRRANAAKNYLISRGIARNRIETISYGKSRPEFLGKDEYNWSKNRRAVIVVK